MQQMRLSGLLIHVLRKPAFATRCFTSAQTVDPAHRRATASRDNFPEILPFLAAPSDTTHVIKKKNDELRNVLKTLQWPRLRAFEVAGHIYRLPLHSPAQRVRAEATVQYLGGFFRWGRMCQVSPKLVWMYFGSWPVCQQSWSSTEILGNLRRQYHSPFGWCRTLATYFGLEYWWSASA